MAMGTVRASGHYIRKRLGLARPACRLGAFAMVFLAAGVVVFRLGGIDFEALKAVFVVGFAMAAATLVIASVGLARVWTRGHQGGGAALGALAFSIAALAPFAFAGVLAFDNPPVSAASSDGMLANDIASGAAPEPEEDEEAATAISGRRFQATAAQVFDVSKLVLADLGWTVRDVSASAPDLEDEDENGDLGISGTIEIPVPTPRASVDAEAANDPLNQPDSEDYTIETVANGPVLALPSDVTIRIVEDGSEAFVDLRSVSRVVSADLGQNRRFIEDFLTRLDAAMAGVLTVMPAQG